MFKTLHDFDPTRYDRELKILRPIDEELRKSDKISSIGYWICDIEDKRNYVSLSFLLSSETINIDRGHIDVDIRLYEDEKDLLIIDYSLLMGQNNRKIEDFIPQGDEIPLHELGECTLDTMIEFVNDIFEKSKVLEERMEKIVSLDTFTEKYLDILNDMIDMTYSDFLKLKYQSMYDYVERNSGETFETFIRKIDRKNGAFYHFKGDLGETYKNAFRNRVKS